MLGIADALPRAEKGEAERHWAADIPHAPTETAWEMHSELIVEDFYHICELALSHVLRESLAIVSFIIGTCEASDEGLGVWRNNHDTIA